MSKFTAVKFWTFLFNCLDISKHAYCPSPLSPPPGISVRLFSLKSCSKSQTDLTAGSNINFAIKPKIWRKLLHEENQRFRGYFLFFLFKPLKRWEHPWNVWFSQPFSTPMLTKLWLTKAYLSSMAMILSLLFSDWKSWQTFQWESSSKNCQRGGKYLGGCLVLFALVDPSPWIFLGKAVYVVYQEDLALGTRTTHCM